MLLIFCNCFIYISKVFLLLPIWQMSVLSCILYLIRSSIMTSVRESNLQAGPRSARASRDSSLHSTLFFIPAFDFSSKSQEPLYLLSILIFS